MAIPAVELHASFLNEVTEHKGAIILEKLFSSFSTFVIKEDSLNYILLGLMAKLQAWVLSTVQLTRCKKHWRSDKSLKALIWSARAAFVPEKVQIYNPS